MSASPSNPSAIERGETDSPNALSNDKDLPRTPSGALAHWNAKIESLSGLEVRGIARVPPDDRYEASTFGLVQMALLWFSANLTANNLTLAMLGPLVYELSFVDSALCAVFGAVLGSCGAAYMSTWGPVSGNRTLIVARYFMGYYPAKICALLNIVILIGYGLINCIVGGQILSAVADGNLTIVVGIIIVALVSWVVATFGMSVFHQYERWAWLPQIIVLFVLVGSAGPKFNTEHPSQGSDETINGQRLSFLSLCLSAPIAWAPSAADYYVYYPEATAKWKTFLMTFSGFVLSFSFVYLMGVGLASATFSNPDYAGAYSTSSGALIVQGYRGLGGFGKFCGVVVALSAISNNCPNFYSAALGFQVLGRYLQRIPRWFFTCVSAVIAFACAIGGRNSLFDIFENFLALMGYWVIIFLSIVVEEHFTFRRHQFFDWTAWDDRQRLPVGVAALSAFLIGWAGAIVSMDQIYFMGPLAKMVGEDGADLGIWVSSGFTLVVYPPLRALELKNVGR